MRKKIESLILYGNKKSGINLRFLLENYPWMFFQNVVTIIAGLGFSVIFARIATREVYGQFGYATSIITLLALFSIPGLNTAIFRSVSRGFDGTYKKATRLMFFSSTLGVPVLMGLGVYHYYFVSKILGLCFLFSSVFSPVFHPSKVWGNLLQAQEKFRKFAIYVSILSIVRLILVGSVIFITRGSLLPIFITYILVELFVNSYLYIKTLKFVRNNKVEEGWKSTGYRLSISSIFNKSYAHSDKILLMFFLGAEKLAIYSIAVALVTTISNILSLFVRVYLPKIYRSDSDYLIYFIKKRLLVILVILLIGLAAIYFLVPLVIISLYSTKYSESIVVAQAYLLTIPFHFFVVLSSGILFKERKENYYISSMVGAGIINLCLYFILIPLLGIMGAVIGSIAFFLIQVVINWVYILTKIGKSANV
jgi:O-antigen/teichoic acid export membrane protein